MTSNEHPDMSGSACDSELICDYCDYPIEEETWENPLLPGLVFCCSECIEDYIDEHEELE